MSWLSKRVQTARIRGRKRKKQKEEIRRWLPSQAGEKTKARFLSASIDTDNAKGDIRGSARSNSPFAEDRTDAK